MATYTAVADANGDFIVPFSSNYTGGEKITVSAEKAGAIKTIELFAVSDATGGGMIQFSGDMVDFPYNIGNITLESGFSDSIINYAFYAAQNSSSIFKRATGLTINAQIKNIGSYAFFDWSNSKFLNLPESLQKINDRAFQQWRALTSLILPMSITNIGSFSFLSCNNLSSVKFESLSPPVSGNSIFADTAANLKIYVPIQSLAAYKSTAGLSEYASIMIGY